MVALATCETPVPLRVTRCLRNCDRLLAGPELTETSGLEVIVSGAIADGLADFSFEEPGRFPLPPELQAQVCLEFPNAERLWQAWQATRPEVREKWLTESPQPMYLKPPHITPAKPQGSRGVQSAS